MESIFINFSWWCYSDFPFRFLLTPFIFLYVCTYTNPVYKPSTKTKFLLFIPAVIELIYFISISIFYYLHPTSAEERAVIANRSLYYFIRTFLALLFNLTCIIFTYREIKLYALNILHVLSDNKNLRINWIKVIITISIILYSCWFVAFTIEIFNPKISQLYLVFFILYMLIALVVLVFGYFAILTPYTPEAYLKLNSEIASIDNNKKIMQNEIAINDNMSNISKNEAASIKGDLDSEKEEPQSENLYFKKCFHILENYLQTEKVFTQPDITLTDISNKLKLSSFVLSKSIKQHSIEGSFYEYINKYRLVYFLDLLAKTDNDAYTILSLAQKSGFSSPSTLNKYCKKITGYTPTAVKQLLKEGKNPSDLLISN